MSTTISTSQDFIRERTEKTRAAQATLATDAAWTWPMKTLAQWDADLVSLDPVAAGSTARVAAQQEADMLTARGLLDARLDAIHKFTLLAVGVMRVRVATVPALAPMTDDLSARGDSRRTIEEEADALHAAWEEWEQFTAGPFLPAPGKTFASFKDLVEGAAGPPVVTSLAVLKKNYKAATTKWRRSEGLLNVLFARLEDDCVAWYAEATKVFPEGTAEGDMIRGDIPTDYQPPTPGGSPSSSSTSSSSSSSSGSGQSGSSSSE